MKRIFRGALSALLIATLITAGCGELTEVEHEPDTVTKTQELPPQSYADFEEDGDGGDDDGGSGDDSWERCQDEWDTGFSDGYHVGYNDGRAAVGGNPDAPPVTPESSGNCYDGGYKHGYEAGFADGSAGDIDADGKASYEDNCSVVSNADQTDSDGDGIGDNCDEDNASSDP